MISTYYKTNCACSNHIIVESIFLVEGSNVIIWFTITGYMFIIWYKWHTYSIIVYGYWLYYTIINLKKNPKVLLLQGAIVNKMCPPNIIIIGR